MNKHLQEHIDYELGADYWGEIAACEQINGENEFHGDETDAEISAQYAQYSTRTERQIHDLSMVAIQTVSEAI